MWMLSLVGLAVGEAIWVEGEDATTSEFNQHGWYSAVNLDLLSPGTPGGEEGDWLAHYANNSTEVQASWQITAEEGGDYELWIRSASYRVGAWVQVDEGEEVDLDLDATARETLNLVAPSLDVRFLSWTHVGTVSLEAGVHDVTIGLTPHEDWAGSQIYGGVDAFVLINDGRAPSGAELAEAGTPAADEWFPFFPGDPPEDWSESVAAWTSEPATQRVQVDGGALVLEDGSPIKLWGVNSRPPRTEALMEQQAAMYAAFGINLVRVHSVHEVLGDPVDEEALDRLDRWFAILQEHGIYTQWSVFYPYTIDEDAGYARYDELPSGSTSGLVTVFEELQELEWAYLEALLAHENPYTGTSYAEDPALAVIEVRNEDSIFWHAPLNTLMGGTMPEHEAALEGAWRDWLLETYVDDAGLAAAWGDGLRSGDTLEAETLDGYAAWELAADGPSDADETARAGDWIRFLAERQREGYEARFAAMRAAGFEGLTISTAWKSGGEAAELANLWTDVAGDVVDRHAYWGGGEGGHSIDTGTVATECLLDDADASWLSTSGPLPADTPFLHSEWTSKPPNVDKYEAVPLYALYGMGLHGWDGSLHFTASTAAWVDGGWPDLSSYVSETPHYMGQFFALSRAAREQHVTEAVPAARLSISEAELFGGTDARPDLDERLAALGPVVVVFEEDGADTGIDADAHEDGDYLVSEELAWRAGAHVRVSAAATQGVFGPEISGTHPLLDVTLDIESEAGSVLLTALDGLPLAESGAVLVTALGRDLQTGAAYAEDGSTLLAVGGPPLLLEPIQATLGFARTPLTVTALDVYGVPQEALDEAIEGDTVVIDGRFRTAWYLVTFEVAETGDTGDGETGDVEDTDEAGPVGCGCSGAGTAAGGGSGLLLLLLGWGRRRRES